MICLPVEARRLPDWKSGLMDIHHISTGRGNATYMVMPDGSTMLIDLGDDAHCGAKVHNEVLPQLPDSTLSAAGWVRVYMNRFGPCAKRDWLDYALLTHFDSDHIGAPWSPMASTVDSLSYRLTGITELGSRIHIGRLVDRAYPDYPAADHIHNYSSFVTSCQGRTVGEVQRFRVGVRDQFTPASVGSDFSILNVCGNGEVWTGEGESVRRVFDGGGENENSCAILLSYGSFRYLHCGDIVAYAPKTENMVSAVAAVVGRCNIVSAPHHAFQNSMNREFCVATSPDAYVVPVREYWHPSGKSVKLMCDEEIHQGRPQIFCTGMLDSQRLDFDAAGYGKYFMPAGHIVVRVHKGGRSYRIYVLDDHVDGNRVIWRSPKIKLEENRNFHSAEGADTCINTAE